MRKSQTLKLFFFVKMKENIYSYNLKDGKDHSGDIPYAHCFFWFFFFFVLFFFSILNKWNNPAVNIGVSGLLILFHF